jgi:hypothetical protein
MKNVLLLIILIILISCSNIKKENNESKGNKKGSLQKAHTHDNS